MADVQEVVLSERERECLRWIEQGKSSWEIGVILNVSENTVNFHVKNAMRKLETTSRTQCVVKARRLGLI
ncbi:response regulator transcription factor [Bradyrhizobium sp. STM 3561]|uniref:response regulator transcription factor n=1 Tax=Bradyrhizobium sp. STM 3561 TaxID=578923 RepID=UPI0038909058